MLSIRKEFENTPYCYKLRLLTKYGVYLMKREQTGYFIYLFGYKGFYVEVWYTPNEELCKIKIIDVKNLDPYLDRIVIVFA